MISTLKQASQSVTGREPTQAEATRWSEVAELLAAELRSAAERTNISSVPAFLAEHLRRRLARPSADPQARSRPVVEPPASQPPPPPTDDEAVEIFVNFLHTGMTLEDLDQNFSASVEPERWPRIRAAVLERYEAERKTVGQKGGVPKTD